jgi:uncharacterized membrane protein
MLGFVGGHFLLSWPPLRARLAGAIGERAFLGVYSLLAAGFLTWAIFAYKAAPRLPLWDWGAAGRYIALVVMPVALLLAVIGLSSRNPTAVAGESALDTAQAVRGIVTITRHPFLWGAALWALSHLAANGNAAALVFFGGMALLALAGMAAIDHKRAVNLGAKWQRFSAATSAIPFAAALGGRTAIDWQGIGWLRPLVALALYAAMLYFHRALIGVPIFP